MIIIPRKKAIILTFFILCAVITLIAPQKKDIPVFSGKVTKRIVIDAGHGFPDGGAVSSNGTVESVLNLKIALFAGKILKDKGYTVIYTRKDDNALTNEGNSYSQRKKNDMKKRLEIINKSDADMFISIHINKFEDSRYNGAQVIYSENFAQSQILAQHIQNRLHKVNDSFSKRKEMKSDRNIFLLEKASVPAVLVECGFLSNFAEEQFLIKESYQKQLAEAIALGVEDYYNYISR